MAVASDYKPVTPWQWLEQDLDLFALYCMCDGQQRMIGTRAQGLEKKCCICGETFKPRKEAGL